MAVEEGAGEFLHAIASMSPEASCYASIVSVPRG